MNVAPSAAMRPSSLALVLVFAACASERTMGEQSFAPTRLKIITHSSAVQEKLEGARFEVAFGDGENGTTLLFRFLDFAEHQGNTRVSDIEIETTTVHKGELRRCTSRLFVSGDPALASSKTSTAAEPSQRRTREVRETVLRCSDVLSEPCRRVALTQEVTRFENYLEANFTPPDLGLLGERHSTRALEESEPMCVAIDKMRPDKNPPHRLRAVTYKSL